MKKIIILTLLGALLLLPACGGTEQATQATAATTTEFSVPQDLPGVWVSANSEQEIIETITFEDDGTISISATYLGVDAGTISGTYEIDGDVLYCYIEEGADPFTSTFRFAVDGRELTLTDDGGDARYLRVS